MVTIVDFKVSVNDATGEKFVSLILEGDLEFVKSKQTNRIYATARRVIIPSTFNEERSKKMIGKEMEGFISKVDCESYDYTIPSSSEVIKLSHRYEYVLENPDTEVKKDFSKESAVKADLKQFSTNGIRELEEV